MSAEPDNLLEGETDLYGDLLQSPAKNRGDIEKGGPHEIPSDQLVRIRGLGVSALEAELEKVG